MEPPGGAHAHSRTGHASSSGGCGQPSGAVTDGHSICGAAGERCGGAAAGRQGLPHGHVAAADGRGRDSGRALGREGRGEPGRIRQGGAWHDRGGAGRTEGQGGRRGGGGRGGGGGRCGGRE
eukprot:scaffold18381_cov79-Phaeocystis_antarctica.AAC.6